MISGTPNGCKTRLSSIAVSSHCFFFQSWCAQLDDSGAVFCRLPCGVHHAAGTAAKLGVEHQIERQIEFVHTPRSRSCCGLDQVERVEELGLERAGAAAGGDRTVTAQAGERARGGDGVKPVRCLRSEGRDQRRQGAAGTDHARHQRVAPRRRPSRAAVGDVIDLAGDGNDRPGCQCELFGGVQRGVGTVGAIDPASARVKTRERQNFGSIAANRRRFRGQEVTTRLRAVIEKTDRHRVQRSRHTGLVGGGDLPAA